MNGVGSLSSTELKFILVTAAEGPRPGMDRDRQEYRKAGPPGAGDKKADVGAGSTQEFQFRGGFGRGRGGGPPRE